MYNKKYIQVKNVVGELNFYINLIRKFLIPNSRVTSSLTLIFHNLYLLLPNHLDDFYQLYFVNTFSKVEELKGTFH